MTSKNSVVASAWGSTSNGGAAQSFRTENKEFFKLPGLYTTTELTTALRYLGQAIVAEHVKNGHSRTEAGKMMKEQLIYVKTLLYQVAHRPHLLGNISGISMENAVLAQSGALLRLNEMKLGAFFNIPAVKEMLTVTTTSWASMISSKYDVMDKQGLTSFSNLATARGFNAEYYPAAVATIAKKILDRYSARPTAGDEFITEDVVTQVYGGAEKVNSRSMNGIFGRYFGYVTLLEKSLYVTDDVLDYRRDDRAFTSGITAPSIREVLVLPTYAMRGVISAMLEMSIELGDVLRTTTEASSGAVNAPKRAVYEIAKGSDFADLVDLVCTYKRFYNPTSVAKDVPAFRETYQDNRPVADILLDSRLRWANVTVNQNGNYVINSSAIVVEIETRMRVNEYNNSALCDGPKPVARSVGIPHLTYFLKYPTEAVVASEVVNAAVVANEANVDYSSALRTSTIGYFKKLSAKRRGGALDKAAIEKTEIDRAIVANVANFVVEKCITFNLIHIARCVSNAVQISSVSAAVVTKQFK